MPAFPSIGRRALRQGRVSVPGQMYLLTTVTRHRECLFADPAHARVASRVIHAASTWADSRLLAWVLMPDHWHGLSQLGDEPLGRVMNRFKACASRALHESCGLDGPPWDRSFHDHALRAEEDIRGLRDTSSPIQCVPAWPTACLPIPTGMSSGSIATHR
ncbi:MAG TPA: transposase [Rhodanobacter sp.]